MKCEYCLSEGAEPYVEGAAVCAQCQVLLRNPEDGLRLIRGHLCMKLRGTGDQAQLKALVDAGLQLLGRWGPR